MGRDGAGIAGYGLGQESGHPHFSHDIQIIVAGGTITQKNYATGSGTVSVSIDATCPLQVNIVMVSDSTRFTIAFGSNDPTGLVSTLTIDPLMVRWSDQESYSVWTPQVTNQAGSYRLSQGSQIISAIQTRQEILIWTDVAVYSMQFIGAPYVWSFQLMGANISIVSQNSVATANNMTYWMGIDKFYVYSGKVDTLPCALRQTLSLANRKSSATMVPIATMSGPVKSALKSLWSYLRCI